MRILIFIIMFIGTTSVRTFAQTDTIQIKTSALCDMCKNTIEHDLSFEKGVKKSVLDIDSKVLTVIYNPEKTNPDKIRTAISKSGYDADSVKADPKAFKRLPDCCKDPKLME